MASFPHFDGRLLIGKISYCVNRHLAVLDFIFIDLLTTISRNISKRILKLIAKDLATSRHHSQGKLHIVIIFVSLKIKSCALCELFYLSSEDDEESRKDVYREKETSISRGGEKYFERRREVYR